MMYTVHYSARVQGLTFPLGVSTLGCFSNTITCTVFGAILHTGATVIMTGNSKVSETEDLFIHLFIYL